ncbi:hypothetical protein [Kordiimonas aquimaris]|uniref:hypothetical protein n=1 Tax=Kordiimonas aquimaris TaxID=707591 RepID=UPI0021D19B3F|nr:hypothetical protein [Kordiimonas aquimaris]
MTDKENNDTVPQLTADPQSGFDGSTVKPLYVERKPTVYGVMESELENLTAWNFISNISFSVGSFFLSIFIALNIEFVGAEPMDALASSFITWMKWASGILVIVSWCLGIYFWFRRKNQISIIKRESKISN